MLLANHVRRCYSVVLCLFFQWYPWLREIRTAKEEDLLVAEENMAVETKYVEEAFTICSRGGGGGGVVWRQRIRFLDIVMGSSLGWIHAI